MKQTQLLEMRILQLNGEIKALETQVKNLLEKFEILHEDFKRKCKLLEEYQKKEMQQKNWDREREERQAQFGFYSGNM